MTSYLFRRLLALIPVLLWITLILYVLLHMQLQAENVSAELFSAAQEMAKRWWQIKLKVLDVLSAGMNRQLNGRVGIMMRICFPSVNER